MSAEKLKLLKRIGLILIGLIVISSLLVWFFAAVKVQLGSLVFALTIGMIGASISFARRIPSLSEEEESALASSWWALVTPMLVGLIMGGLLFFIFFSGILTGDGGKGLFTSNLFPNFKAPESSDDGILAMDAVLQIRPESVQDFGKLLVWCFLAGHSEKFVPSILKNLENRGGTKGGGKQQ